MSGRRSSCSTPRSAQIAAAERAIAQSENLLSLLQGSVPPRRRAAESWKRFRCPAQMPPGLPSALLERRPDIREAEQNLVAANAQIGAARALYFPQLSLSAFAGGQSRYLLDIATAPARVYTVAPSALQSIFHAGQIRNQVRFSEAQQRELLITYQRSIYTALREVSDALVELRPAARAAQRRRSNWCAPWKTRSACPNCAIAEAWTATFKCWTRSEICSADSSRWRNCVCRSVCPLCRLYRALGGGWS